MGPLTDKQFWEDILKNLKNAGGGLLASTAGAPVDIATMLLRPAGYDVPDKNVFGSSEHIGGLLGADTESIPYKVTSLLPTDATDLMRYGALAPGLLGSIKKVEGVQQPKKIAMEYKRFKSGDKQGIYRGSEAFGGISPAKLGSMRSQYLDKMGEGVPGKYWYDDSSQDIMRITGSDKTDFKKADDLANMLAVTSSRTPVAPNFMYAAKGWNQKLVGDPIRTGGFPVNMGKEIERVTSMDAGAAGGLKRSPFSAGLAVGWRGEDFASRPVHDIHDVRAWGITDPKTGEPWSKGVGDAGHRFLDDQGQFVTNKANEMSLGGKDDWTPYRAQAAAWVAQKAKKEGIPVSEAAKHYGTAIPDYSAMVTRSWSPADNSGHLKGLLDLPEAKQVEFNNLLEEAVRGPQGQDKVAMGLGLLSDTTLANAGKYEGKLEPGFSSLVPVGKETGSQMVDSASRKGMDALAASHGLLGVQKQSAWNFAGGELPIGDAGVLRFVRPDGKPYDVETLRMIQNDLEKAGGDLAMVDPKGARALVFNEGATEASARAIEAAKASGAPEEGLLGIGKEAKKAAQDARKPLMDAAKDIAKKYGADLEFRARDGNIFPVDENFNAPATWSAKPYVEKIEAAGPNVVQNFDQNVAPMATDILQRVETYAAQNGLSSAPYFKPMMEGLARGGIAELKKLIAAGVVPVAALALLLPAIESQGTGPGA